MCRRRCIFLFGSLLAATQMGCSVDLNAAASNAVQSVFNSLFAIFSANLANTLAPVGG